MQALLSKLVLGEQLRPLRYCSALLLFGAIVVAGSIPGARAEIGNLASGIVLHSAAYGCLTFLLYTGTTGTRRYRVVRSLLTVAAMGAVDELVQGLLPYRVGTLLDWAVDCSAAALTAALLWAYLPGPVDVRQP